MKNTNTADYLVSVRQVIESKPTNLHAEIINLSKHYAGDENRFIRQEIINDLIGIKHPIAKCGVGSLATHTMTYLKQLEQAVIAMHDEANAEMAAEVMSAMEGETDELDLGEVTTNPAITEASKTITKAAVGMEVIRKQCQRKGSVTAIEGLKVVVTLEDGSVRRPCSSRFLKLYNQA